jgi:hypothetical protein
MEDTDVIDEVDHLQQFETIKSRSIGTKTKKSYDNRIIKIKKSIGDQNTELHTVDPKEIIRFIVSQSKKKNGQLKSASTPEGYRNALVYHFKQIQQPLPITLGAEMMVYLKGLKNTIAQEKSDGNYKITEGKDVLEFNTYILICEIAIRENYYDGHSFFTLCWNLTVRADTVANCNFNHISWATDCMRVSIPKEKTRQSGADRGLTHDIHVYANPLKPEICAFLSLGIKLLCTSVMNNNGRLFDSTNIYETYASWLFNVIESMDKETAALIGFDKETADIGTQSVRKGSISYMLSYAGQASNIACLLRGGWQLGGVLPKYVRQMLNGDQAAGRLVCGLPPNLVEFSLLCARFKLVQTIAWSEFVPYYDVYPVGFQQVIPYLIASVVFHNDDLLRLLPKNHAFFTSRYVRYNYFDALKSLLLQPTLMHCDVTNMKATGISPMTSVLYQLHRTTLINQSNNNLTSNNTTNNNNSTSSSYSTQYIPSVFTGLSNNSSNNLNYNVSSSTTSSGSSNSNNNIDFTTATLQQLVQAVTTLSATVESMKAAGWQPAGPVAPPADALAPVPLQLNQAITSAQWPVDVTLRVMHDLWYEGNKAKSLPPYRFVAENSTHMEVQVKKRITQAKMCIGVLNKRLTVSIEEYCLCNNAQKDAHYSAALNVLTTDLIAGGLKENKPGAVMKKLLYNKYCSLYENDFLKYLKNK